MKASFKNAGFTLVELLLASTLGTFIALVAVGTLRVLTTTTEIANGNIDAAAEVRFASELIARDLVNLYRDQDVMSMKLVGAAQEVAQGTTTSVLTFYTVNRVKARADQAEADVYEVEYYLVRDEEQSALCRRLWPYPDPNDEVEPGGVLTAIADNIDVFEVRYFDGSEWSDEWPEEMQTVPQLVEVNIVSIPPPRGSPAVASIMVNLVRSVGATAETLESTQQGGQQQGTSGGQQQGTGGGQQQGTGGGQGGSGVEMGR